MKERKIASKAILILKASPKERRDYYLIDAQKYRLQEYCTRKGLEVLKIFESAESSSKGNRKKFMKAIDFAKQQEETHKEIIAVVIDKAYGLERGDEEMRLLYDIIEKEQIELHFYIESCIIHKYPTAQDRLIWNSFIMIGHHYVNSLRNNIKRALEQKRKINSN